MGGDPQTPSGGRSTSPSPPAQKVNGLLQKALRIATEEEVRLQPSLPALTDAFIDASTNASTDALTYLPPVQCEAPSPSVNPTLAEGVSGDVPVP